MKPVLKALKGYWPTILLVLIEAFLFVTNYKPGTYLIGWDNLFPEFNFAANIKRELFGAWQEYRGLGLEDGMSHAANLPHTIFIYLLHFVLPQNALRYIFVFLMHLVGGIGMYALISNLFGKNRNKKVIGFLTTLFYLFNFATIQMFYLPFELFLVHFAFLPWLIWSARKYISSRNKRDLFLFGIFSLLSTPQAHVPTLFLVYLMLLSIYLFITIVNHGRKILPQIAILIIITFCINSYWGLPFVLSTLKNAQAIANSKNNQMATQDIYLKNHKYGDFKNTALMRSFSLDYVQYDPVERKPDFIFSPWKNYIDNPLVSGISWLLFFSTLTGAILIVYKKHKELYPFVGIYVFAFVIIGNDIVGISSISYLLNTYVPLFQNVFRFVFTKFFIMYAFGAAVLLAVTIAYILNVCHKVFYKPGVLFFTGMVILMFGIYTLPSFKGNFVFSNLRAKIPLEYFDLMSYFKMQPIDERIAIFPMPWYWAWTQYNWGLINSGFEWFGIPQPSLDRAFDPWSNNNENYYWETNQALYSVNADQFNNLLNKYSIYWIIIDKNIINPNYNRSLYLDQLDKLIQQNPQIHFEKQFGNIAVYRVGSQTKQIQNVNIKENLSNLEPVYNWNDNDTGFSNFGDYFSDSNTITDIYYPFRSLFSGHAQTELEYAVTSTNDALIFKANIPPSDSKKIIIPSYKDKLVDYDPGNPKGQKLFYPSLFLNGQLLFNFNAESTNSATEIPISSASGSNNLEIHVPKVYNYYSYDSELWNDFNQTPKSCDLYNANVYEHELLNQEGKKVLRLTSVGSSNCIDFYLPFLPQRLSYLVTLETRHLEGKTLFVSITNKETKRSFLDTYLDYPDNAKSTEYYDSYFVIPPMGFDGLGYNINIDNISIGREKTVNELRRITVFQIPYYLLTSIKLASSNSTPLPTANNIQPTTISHPNPAEYWVTLADASQIQNATLTLSQSFNSGWLAWQIPSCLPTGETGKLSDISCKLKNLLYNVFPYLFGKRLTDHVLVNNWANGWIMEPSAISRQQSDCLKAESCQLNVYIFFWPQVLEYLGLILLAAPFILMLPRFKI